MNQRLNLPVAILKQDDARAISFHAGNRNITSADHEIDMDERIVHAQLAVLFLGALRAALHVFAIGSA